MGIHTEHHIFLSYSRSDNQPVETGWVTTFKELLEVRHRRYSGRPLKIFFDTEAIEEGIDWRTRLRMGLRSSRLFLAFLSPNYVTSENCLWEWEEYLRLEHSVARGSDGVTPIFFVSPRDLSPAAGQAIQDWLQDMQVKYPWFHPRPLKPNLAPRLESFAKDLHRRNRTANMTYPDWVELQPWFDRGPEVLRELDAAERSAEVKAAVQANPAGLGGLDERLDNLDRHICRRLDRLALADSAPHNIRQAHLHFVGRHRELSKLHDTLIAGGGRAGGRGSGGRGLIAAAHSPGGMGKTALARQYCHAYAEFYAAGGTWEISCEGVTTIGDALVKLAADAEFQRMGANENFLLTLSDEQRADDDLAARAVLSYLRHVTTEFRGPRLRADLAAHPERHSPTGDLVPVESPRALLLFDNVDQAELFSQKQAALLPAEGWLEVLVTTRLDPYEFGTADERWQSALEIEPLPVGSSRVDLQACKLEYSIVSPK